MKNKILLLAFLSTFIIYFYNYVPVYAALPSNYTYIIGVNDPGGSYPYAIMECSADPQNIQINSNSISLLAPSAGCYSYKRFFQTFAAALQFWNENFATMSTSDFKYRYTNTVWTYDNQPSIVMKGSVNIVSSVNNDNFFPTYNDYLESIAPKWYEVLWNDFKDFVSDLGLALLSPFDPNSIIDIADWFENAWTVKVGEGEDDLLNQIEVITPTPTPVPPTPIPYQTVIVPDGNGGSIIQYKYLNPSGTPIITDQPPQQNVNVNNDDDGFEYPYYENPENKDNPFKFKIPWYLKLVLRHNDIDIDTLDDHYQVAQNQVQSEDVVEAVNEVYNGFQVLPTDWLLLLGAIASIPLFAALIHRFLQG